MPRRFVGERVKRCFAEPATQDANATSTAAAPWGTAGTVSRLFRNKRRCTHVAPKSNGTKQPLTAMVGVRDKSGLAAAEATNRPGPITFESV